MQIMADIFGLPATCPKIYEASALGAAINVSIALKLHPNFTTAVNRMNHLGEAFLPEIENHKLYQDVFQQVYTKLYSRLKPLYQAAYNKNW